MAKVLGKVTDAQEHLNGPQPSWGKLVRLGPAKIFRLSPPTSDFKAPDPVDRVDELIARLRTAAAVHLLVYTRIKV